MQAEFCAIALAGPPLFATGTLQATISAVANAIAGLAMGAAAEAAPGAIVREAERWVSGGDGPGAASGLRPIMADMFR